LLPALNKAREKAKAISCSSNLKQISLVATMYSGDYDNWLIPINDKLGNPWTLVLQNLGYVENILKLREDCYNPLASSYSAFYGMMRTSGLSTTSRKLDKIGFSTVAPISPSKFPFIMDSIKTGTTAAQTYYIYWTGTSSFSSNRFINMRHSKRANIAAADGHVLSVTDGDAKNDFSLGGANNARIIVGNGGPLDIFNLYQ
jgi:prepilin-type processing-associated H-X9-DG protein